MSDISPTGEQLLEWMRDFVREGGKLVTDTPESPLVVVPAHETVHLVDANIWHIPPVPEGQSYATVQISGLRPIGTNDSDYNGDGEILKTTQNIQGMVRIDFIGSDSLTRTIRFITWATSVEGRDRPFINPGADWQLTFFQQLQEADDLINRSWEERFDTIFEFQFESVLDRGVRKSDQVSDPL